MHFEEKKKVFLQVSQVPAREEGVGEPSGLTQAQLLRKWKESEECYSKAQEKVKLLRDALANNQLKLAKLRRELDDSKWEKKLQQNHFDVERDIFVAEVSFYKTQQEVFENYASNAGKVFFFTYKVVDKKI